MTQNVGGLIGKLPRNTPSWAVGIIAVFISVSITVAIAYITARPELQSYLTSSARAEEEAKRAQTNIVQTILSLVTENTKQITTMSSSLQVAQSQNFALSARISEVEKDLAVTKTSLSDCQNRLFKK